MRSVKYIEDKLIHNGYKITFANSEFIEAFKPMVCNDRLLEDQPFKGVQVGRVIRYSILERKMTIEPYIKRYRDISSYINREHKSYGIFVYS